MKLILMVMGIWNGKSLQIMLYKKQLYLKILNLKLMKLNIMLKAIYLSKSKLILKFKNFNTFLKLIKWHIFNKDPIKFRFSHYRQDNHP